MASLWLAPNTGHPFTKEFEDLMVQMPSNFSHKLEKHKFMPHVTITSEIDPKTYGDSPQEWLDSLTLPEFKKESNEVVVELDHPEAGEPFFRKLVIEVNQDKNLTKLAARCRQETGADDKTAEKWASDDYKPHMSLMYADLPVKDVQNKLTLVEMQIGFGLGSLFACCGGSFALGGQMVLVDTTKPIAEWQPIATRATPWVNWRMSRNLA